ncbi:hypothetical protein L1887_05948 [Cichorium endivia]|nr:hypothetical protein L1887_05948 [Cichorium endivia]
MNNPFENITFQIDFTVKNWKINYSFTYNNSPSVGFSLHSVLERESARARARAEIFICGRAHLHRRSLCSLHLLRSGHPSVRSPPIRLFMEA